MRVCLDGYQKSRLRRLLVQELAPPLVGARLPAGDFRGCLEMRKADAPCAVKEVHQQEKLALDRGSRGYSSLHLDPDLVIRLEVLKGSLVPR